MSALKAIQNERGHWEKDFGSVKQHTPDDCPKCLQAANARLQEQVKVAEKEHDCGWALREAIKVGRKAAKQRDEARALAERRGEALEEAHEHIALMSGWKLEDFRKARAAIAATPVEESE